MEKFLLALEEQLVKNQKVTFDEKKLLNNKLVSVEKKMESFLKERIFLEKQHILSKNDEGGIILAFFNKKEEVVIPEIETNILSCVNEECNGWMRQEFASFDELCPLCGSSTNLKTKILPEITKDLYFKSTY